MKYLLTVTIALLLCGASNAQNKPIVIETKNTALVYKTGFNNRLMQVYFGNKLNNIAEYESLSSRNEIYPTAGMNNLNEPAIRMVHNDGNPSLELKFQ